MNLRDRTAENSNKANYDYERQLEDSMRTENDGLIGVIGQNISNIKNYSLRIQDKIKHSKNELDDTNKRYSESNSLLHNTLSRLGDVLAANSNYFCYLIIFIFFVFFFLYKITG